MGYYNSDIQTIISEYNHQQAAEKRKARKIVWLITAIALLISAILFVFSLNAVDDMSSIFYYSLIFPGVMLIIVIVIELFFYSAKPLFNYLYPEAIKEININDETNMRIQSFLKEKEFIKEGGLFPLGSGRIIRYKISFTNEYGIEVEIYDVYIFTQANKTRIVHIDGLYFTFKCKPELVFQIRKNGRPKSKGNSLQKLTTRTDLKAYVESGDAIPEKYYTLYDNLSVDRMKVYLSGVGQGYHVGLHGYHKYRKLKVLDQVEFEGLKDYIRRLVKIADKIYQGIKK